MRYHDELQKAMELLAEDPRTVFLGQAVGSPGTVMTHSLKNIEEHRKIELPVFEETQMGISTGLSLTGLIPVSIYPRWNFLLLAANQLVNHLDKIHAMSQCGYSPKVIIRTGIGSQRPLHPGHQHIGDFSEAFDKMLTTVNVVKLEEPGQIVPAYQEALDRVHSTILVEYGDYHNEK